MGEERKEDVVPELGVAYEIIWYLMAECLSKKVIVRLWVFV